VLGHNFFTLNSLDYLTLSDVWNIYLILPIVPEFTLANYESNYNSSVKVTIGHNTPDVLHVGSPWPCIRMKYTYS
jgi:hypothetical protein